MNEYWAELSMEAQYELLQTIKFFTNNHIIYDIVENPYKLQYIKGIDNKTFVITHIMSAYCINIKLLSELYHYFPDYNYTDKIKFIIYEGSFIKLQAKDCSEELFDYIINNISKILESVTSANNFFGYFKDLLNEERMININNNLPKGHNCFDCFYHYAEWYFGKEFKNQLEFINKLR